MVKSYSTVTFVQLEPVQSITMAIYNIYSFKLELYCPFANPEKNKQSYLFYALNAFQRNNWNNMVDRTTIIS